MSQIQKIWKTMKEGRYNVGSLIVSLKKDVNAMKSVYGSLMSKYNDSPEILRHYADFLDNAEGETEKAEELQAEANEIEEKGSIFFKNFDFFTNFFKFSSKTKKFATQDRTKREKG